MYQKQAAAISAWHESVIRRNENGAIKMACIKENRS